MTHVRRLLYPFFLAIAVLANGWLIAAPPDMPDLAHLDFFETRIRPLLAEKCRSCHGERKQEGGLRLTERGHAIVGGDRGAAVAPGNPEASLLLRAVDYETDLKMPPDGRLADDEIANLVQWIQDGAVWPDDGRSHGSVPEVDAAAKGGLWSLQPVRDVPLPGVKLHAWPSSPIDYFILAMLEQRDLVPSAPADKRTLLRRTTFDLTGLPPSPQELREFQDDRTPGAFEKVVERLLASPQYGERWGRHWLDAVRYADARDLIQLPAESDFREAWRYRDWVVKAFNQDLPYNKFIEMQIAGDLLQPTDPAQIDADALVATGMLAIADFVPGDVNKEQMIADYVNDQVDVVGRAILGLTIACARCHDHKFDPVTTEDYYSLAGIFFSTRLVPGPVPGNTPLVRVPLLPATEIRTLEAQAERDKNRLVELTRQVQTAEDREYVASLEAKVTAALPIDLPVALDYFRSTQGQHSATTTEFAATHSVDPAMLERWALLLQKQPALTALTDESAVEERVAQLTAVAREYRDRQERDLIAGSIAAAQILQFRADDRSIQSDAAGRVILWPDRAPSADDAAPPQDEPGPRMAYAAIQGTDRPVLRFDGESILKTPRVAPTTGALFAVFRPEPSAAGTRLLGWEDSAGGQHGVGLMLMADGGLHAILRRAGVSADVVAPGAGNPEFQLISLTWGSGGVVLFRNGEAIGSNASINSISTDPTIAALHIGGPGAGVGQRFRGDLCELRICAGDLDEVARKRIEAELRDRWLNPAPEQTTSIQQDPLSELYDELLSPRSPYWTDIRDREKAFSEEVRQRLAAERAELESLKHKPAVDIPQAVVVQDGGPPGTKHEGFHDAHVFLRGNPANPGKLVPRGFPHALAGEDPPLIETGSGRLELARWLTQPDNPLTARVMVNRLWQHHFGEGLVRTSTNFGHRGELPSHPELLDYLATRFVESGWSIKAMHRLIVHSSVYQQCSESRISSSDSAQAERHGEVHTDSRSADPENRLLARMPRRRLESEAIRDSLLFVSGLLDPASGGPGFLEVDVPRRTLYLMSVRTGAKTADFNSLFDGPDGGGIVERRNESVVATQSLFLLNDSWIDQVSAALAARILRETPSGSNEDRVRLLYEMTLGRAPLSTEMEIGLRLVSNSSGADAWVRYCRVLLCSNEFLYVD